MGINLANIKHHRLLIGFLLFSTLVLLIIYLNESQNIIRSSSIFMNNAISRSNRLNIASLYDDNERIKIPSERSWTYKCQNGRCVRALFVRDQTNHDEKRVTFMTCSAVCSSSNIWPMPTKSHIGSNYKSFLLHDIAYTVKTNFKNVETLTVGAIEIFLDELKKMSIANGAKLPEQTTTTKQSNIEKKSNGEIGVGNLARNNPATARILVRINILKSSETFLTMKTDECYNMTITSENSVTKVDIFSNTFFGARHGIATLYQLIWYDDEDDILKLLNSVTISDCPKFAYRGLMLDTSRHYFSVEAIKRTLIGMAHSKLNRFHWHITDSQSFPFVSKYFPELAKYGAYSSSEIYTHDDVRQVVEFARVRGIQVIPEIDAPAHSGNGWQWGPSKGLGELSLCINQQPWNAFCGEPPCGQLNPKNNFTYTILQKLYEELIELTGPTDYFHLGGDEVNLECWGQYFNDTDLRTLWCDFMLQAQHRMNLANKHRQSIEYVGVWSSGLTQMLCLPNSRFAVQVWGGSQWSENFQLLTSGFNLIFSHVDAWYLDCGFGSWRSTGDAACSPYRSWQTVYKHRPWSQNNLKPTAKQMKQILGGEACLWTEQVDETTLDDRLWPRAAALGERLWSDPIDENEYALSKETFRRISILRNRLVHLGIKAAAIFPKFCSQNEDECL